MKKLVVMFVMVVLMMTSAYADITDDVWDFCSDIHYEVGKPLIEVWKELDEGELLIKDGRAYLKGGILMEDYFDENVRNIEENIEKSFEEMGAKHFDVHVLEIGRTEDGRKVLWFECNGWYNFNEIYNCGDEPWYGFDFIGYDRY